MEEGLCSWSCSPLPASDAILERSQSPSGHSEDCADTDWFVPLVTSFSGPCLKCFQARPTMALDSRVGSAECQSCELARCADPSRHEGLSTQNAFAGHGGRSSRGLPECTDWQDSNSEGMSMYSLVEGNGAVLIHCRMRRLPRQSCSIPRYVHTCDNGTE